MYEQTYKRLEKLKKTFDNLVKLNQEHVDRIHELNEYVTTHTAREQARERVLLGLEEKLKAYENRESLLPPT